MATEIVAEEIRRLRSARGWTQEDLAREIGTDAVTVSRWERLVSRPRPGALRRLIALLLEDGPSSRVSFSEDPTERLRKLESALRDQLWLKRNVRFPA